MSSVVDKSEVDEKARYEAIGALSTWWFTLSMNSPYVASRHHSISVAASSSDGLSMIHAMEPKARNAACKKVINHSQGGRNVPQTIMRKYLSTAMVRSHYRVFSNKLTLSHHGTKCTTWVIWSLIQCT